MNELTKSAIKAMLTENTGRHLLDSGSAYGRNWERNQDVDFDSLPSVTIDKIFSRDATSSKEISYTINLYHYLVNQLDIDEPLCKRVNDKLKELRENSDEYPHWDSECMDVLENLLEEGETITEVHQVNSYNHESNLSQVIQYTTFEYDNSTYDDENLCTDGYYVMLSIHGGCDVRGGYTDAVCFKIENDLGCPVLDMERVYGTIETDEDTIFIDNCYDGYSLTDENGNEVELTPDEDGEFLKAISLELMDC